MKRPEAHYFFYTKESITPPPHKMKPKLWPHQEEALVAMRDGGGDFLFHHFCGTGKSRIMLEVLREAKKKTLFVFPSKVLSCPVACSPPSIKRKLPNLNCAYRCTLFT